MAPTKKKKYTQTTGKFYKFGNEKGTLIALYHKEGDMIFFQPPGLDKGQKAHDLYMALLTRENAPYIPETEDFKLMVSLDWFIKIVDRFKNKKQYKEALALRKHLVEEIEKKFPLARKEPKTIH